jgi:ABC-type bacteriocin/lantibiotic exporter with double-glycine peptidase domain
MLPPPPPIKQESDDTCALACLRMVLAHSGDDVPEAVLEEHAHKQVGGIAIEDVRDLAIRHGLKAELRQLDTVAIEGWLARGIYPIVYLNRAYFDQKQFLPRSVARRVAIIHAVIPVRVTARFIIFNDPLPGAPRRVSRLRFEAAQDDVNHWCVVCRPSRKNAGGKIVRGEHGE